MGTAAVVIEVKPVLMCFWFSVPFYLHDAMLARVFATATCLDIRLSVCHTPVLCLVARKQDHEMYTSDSPFTLVSGEV